VAGELKLGVMLLVPLGLAAAPEAASQAEAQAFVGKYCATCHSRQLQTGGLILEGMDFARVPASAEIWENALLKLRGGIMPPPNAPRPDHAASDGFAAWIEAQLEKGYFAKPNPGRVGLHRLNRAEYGNAIRDLLALEVDASDLLPADDSNFGFDNIADALSVSPVLLERYLTAAWKIAALAVGDPDISPATTTFRVRPDTSQDRHVEGLPLGTRGGLLARYNFPLDGEYRFKVRLWGNTVATIRGLELPHQVEITVDGRRIRSATIGGQEDADQGNVNPTASAEEIARRLEVQAPVKAGPHSVGVAFLLKSSGPSVDLIQPYQREKLDPINTSGIPEVDYLSISGPFHPTGPGDTPSRRQIFVCRPAAGADEVPCARRILSRLARLAYRRPATSSDMERLLSYYQRGRNNGGSFEAGVENALAFILVNPAFLFRGETDPAGTAAGATYRISDLELASRLSFFLWSSIPDEALLSQAAQGKLRTPAVLEQQVRRMLADRRADALLTNFLGQWLYLRNLRGIVPDQQVFPDFDDNLRQAMLRETELFVGNIMRQDRSVVEMVTADYTFLNERLAKHYGVPGVYGNQFRKVTMSDQARHGLLGQGSVLTVTSYPNRTSPVLRGKWILTNILGTPPPPPPPNAPPLDEVATGSMRERLEQHRSNPACNGCHRPMDPLGYALENFDAIGHWRERDGGSAVDPSGALPDGARLDGPAALRRAIGARPEQFARTVAQMMLTYALGRGLEYYDLPVVRRIARDAARQDYRFSAMVLGIVSSPPFQMRVKSGPAQGVHP
jgi:hypothetical protein